MNAQENQKHRTVEATYCDRCSSSLLVDHENGGQTNVMAIQLSIHPPDIAKQVLGPFEDKTYCFCYRCVLEVMGVGVTVPRCLALIEAEASTGAGAAIPHCQTLTEAEVAQEDVDDE